MAFRFSNTDKWKDSWFSELKPLQKLLFIYFCDNCDIAGFIEFTPKRWAFDLQIKEPDILGAVEGLKRGLIISKDESVFYVRTFLKNQKNLPLNEKNNAHQGILKCFNNYIHLFEIQDINEFILGANKGLTSPYGKGNDKGKGKDKKEPEILNFDFIKSENFKNLLKKWINFRKTIKKPIDTQEQIEANYNLIVKLSNNNLAIAEEIVNNSIANKWQGLFALKQSTIINNPFA